MPLKDKNARGEYLKGYYERNKSHRAQVARTGQYRRQFGISLQRYDEMFSAQDGVCAICHKPAPKGRRLCVDHCHVTKRVRGLLCVTCNVAIAYLGESAITMHDALEYVLADRDWRDL